MSTYRPDKPTRKFSNEFKVSAVRLTFQAGVMIKEVAQSLDIHPFMLSRWRKEYFEGNLVADERKTSKNLTRIPREKELTDSERIKKLEAENIELKKENDFLKKWKRFLAKQRRQNSSL